MSNRRSEIVRTTPADENSQVLSVVTQGGRTLYRRRPCAECPWRVDQTGSFPAKAFEISAPTSYDVAQSTFACHMQGHAKPATCAGFLLKNADNNLSVRLAAMTGRYDPRSISDGGHELHASYRAMAVANGVSPDSPALAPCRDNGEF